MAIRYQLSAAGAQNKMDMPTLWAFPWLAIASVGAVAFFWDGLVSLGEAWSRPEYSYGPLVPVITLYLTLREIHRRPVRQDNGSRIVGQLVLGLAISVGLLGNLAKIPDIITYGFILFVGALVLILAGTREGFRFWPGWLHLIFMLPLPQFIYLHVSTNLQILSSNIGVWFIQLANIPVFLDGNIIDLGTYKLQVAEACSGLRYLFPLFSFGWLIAVLYNGPNWHRVVIFFTTIPVTILMNSFRIGVIGILVNSYGVSHAEGFLHFFEGWIIFISCTLILYFEAWFLWRYLSFGHPRADHVLWLDMEGVFGPLRKSPGISATRAFAAAAVLVLCVGALWQLQPERTAASVSRLPLGIFPMQVEGWRGEAAILDREIERVLGADDYVLATYVSNGEPVSMLMTYYRSQTEGSGIHSPEICIPAGGWEVSRWEQAELLVESADQSRTMRVNRAIIQRGLDRQLVYYWFEQRGRQITNDYEAKFLSVLDTIAMGRSDGGLIRLITPIGHSEEVAGAERRLNSFLQGLLPLVPSYFPSE